jgi:hypothetical protein
MKTSIFDMNFTLPPIVEMTEVEKDMSNFLSLVMCHTYNTGHDGCYGIQPHG